MDSLDDLSKKILSCRICPRLVEYREKALLGTRRFRDKTFWRKPVCGFGDPSAGLLIVGLAPAAMGANRTGRVFTGDKSSEMLVEILYSVGVASQPASVSIDDGLSYSDVFVTLAVKCVPPENKPTSKEIRNCLPYLSSEIRTLQNVRSIVALGNIAFNSVKAVFRDQGFPVNGMKFRHGEYYEIEEERVYCCYHPSPRNINTGKTSRDEIKSVIEEAYGYALASRN